jgi:hypothetical protein
MELYNYAAETRNYTEKEVTVDQVLKKAKIDIIATAGAVKYGGANINTKDAYYNDDYHLTYMTINSYDIGEQLDAEHNAEDESVSLMT